MPGPAPLPTALKVLRGNPGHRELNPSEPKPSIPLSIPEPSPWLSQVAVEEWKRVAPELYRLGLLTSLDLTALACYCTAYADLVEAEATLVEEGQTTETDAGMIRPHPAQGSKNAALKQVLSFSAQFGFTPAARTRLHAPDPATRDNDAVDSFLFDKPAS